MSIQQNIPNVSSWLVVSGSLFGSQPVIADKFIEDPLLSFRGTLLFSRRWAESQCVKTALTERNNRAGYTTSDISLPSISFPFRSDASVKWAKAHPLHTGTTSLARWTFQCSEPGVSASSKIPNTQAGSKTINRMLPMLGRCRFQESLADVSSQRHPFIKCLKLKLCTLSVAVELPDAITPACPWAASLLQQ